MNRIRVNRIIIWIIGIYQILGGLLGLIISFKQGIILAFNHFIYFVIIVLFFSFGIYSGLLLLTKRIKKGLDLSKINQFLQVAQFKIIGNGIEYVAGIYFAIGFSDTPSLNFQYKFAAYKSSCFISLLTDDNEIKVMVNIIAIIILVYLSKRVYLRYSTDSLQKT